MIRTFENDMINADYIASFCNKDNGWAKTQLSQIDTEFMIIPSIKDAQSTLSLDLLS